MNGKPLFVGIDPGLAGGIAAVDALGKVIATFKMPETDRDVFDVLVKLGQSTLDEDGNARIRATIERVSSSPQMGVTSAFTFGRGYGALRMGLLVAEIPFDEVVPRKWQPAIGVIYPKDSSQTEKKNIAKRRAQSLFPGVTVTHANADALLIAEYCRRCSSGHASQPSERTESHVQNAD